MAKSSADSNFHLPDTAEVNDVLSINVSADVTDLTNGDVILTAEFSSDIVRKEYSLDNSFWKEYPTEGVTVTENMSVYFRGFDQTGNAGSVTEFKVENIDKTAPEAPRAAADITKPTNQIVTVTPQFSSDSVIYEYSQNGSEWQTYSDDGVVFEENGSVAFRSYDAAGNVSEITQYYVNNIDHKAPVVPLPVSATTQPTNQPVTVNAMFSHDSVLYEYSQNGSEWQTYDDNGVVFAENGYVDFRSYDAAGNVSPTARYEVTNIDKEPPAKPRISLTRSDYISNEPVTFVAAADEGTLEYSFDSENWQAYTEPVKVYHNTTVYVKTTDEAGNSTVSKAEITAIDTKADSSQSQYIFINSQYTEKNTAGKKFGNNGLQYGINAFASLQEAQSTLKNPADELYVFVMTSGKTVISGLQDNFTGQHINGALPQAGITEEADHDYTVSAVSKNSLNIISGDYSAVDVKWFKNITLSGRAQVSSITGGTYKFTQTAESTVNSKGILTESENYSFTHKSGGKLTADCFVLVNRADYFSNVALDNVNITTITGGNRTEKSKVVYKYQNDLPQKNIQSSGSRTATGSITLKNIASSQIIDGFNTLKITNAEVQTIYGGNDKYSYKEESTYKPEKVTRTVSNSKTVSSSGTLTAQFSILDNIYGVAAVKLTDSTVNNAQNSAPESLNGTFKEKLSVKTSGSGVTAKYEKLDSFKQGGSFTATAKNDRMTVENILYFNTVILNQATAGTIINVLQTQAKEVYQQTYADAAEYGVADDLAINIDYNKAQIISAQYKYSASGSVTLKNNAAADSITDYKTVTLTGSGAAGNIELGDSRTVKYTATYDSNGTVKNSTSTTTYTRTGSVKLTDSSVGGSITGYNKVELNNSNSGNISQSTVVKVVEKTLNGTADVNNSYTTGKLSGTVTLKNNSTAGDISNYATVYLSGSSAGSLSNVNKVQIGKGHGGIISFTGTSGNDKFTIDKGAVFTVTSAMDFGAGNKDTLIINGTLVLHTADIRSLEKISGKGDIAVTDIVAKDLQLDFENLLNLGNTVKNFQGSTSELSDNTAKNAVWWDGEEIFGGWLGNDVDCIDSLDFIKFKTKEDCTLKIASSAWEQPNTDIAAVNNVILNIAGGCAEIALQANTEYIIKLERKESNSMDYTITLA